ncbi:MAG: flavodoxin family protein [Solirubrobacterales bacterium]|nr:flavodoxin family protein [Solirubrobacterales bacterium]
MRALALNATLKPSPQPSSTEALTRVVLDALEEQSVECELVRLVDHDIAPGIVSEAIGDGDEWPALHRKIIAADIVVMATPTWFGRPSSVISRALERMDALLAETDEAGVPVAYNKVAGFVVTGNEDGAHNCIAEMAQAMFDIGFTVPAQAWTYWNKGPGPGEEVYLTTEETAWSQTTGRAAAHNLVAVAHALSVNPIGPPPS